ncbi:hypothetical protein U3516DRAFT_768810 [Neocallimastix sp. 'constans']
MSTLCGVLIIHNGLLLEPLSNFLLITLHWRSLPKYYYCLSLYENLTIGSCSHNLRDRVTITYLKKSVGYKTLTDTSTSKKYTESLIEFLKDIDVSQYENSIKSKISKLESDKCKSLQATNNEAAFNININLILILLSLQLQFNFF